MIVTATTMKASISFILFALTFVSLQIATDAATCGGGNVGDGLCAEPVHCCSEWGWCGFGPSYCNGPVPAPAPVVVTAPTTPLPPSLNDSRMIAYLGNWQACPTSTQLAQYSHIMIAFAVTYTWSPVKNLCSSTCEIATPPICNNQANPELLRDLKAQGKKIIVSFGGAGMGGSWAGDPNDCWDYCFGRESQVVNRLTEIVRELDADGVDIDYEYFYEDNQNGSGFAKGAQAQNFLAQVTIGLRNSLGTDRLVTHAPMDVDLEPHKAYFQLLKQHSYAIDFIMPQYYNGITRPITDGIDGSGAGATDALSHYISIVNEFFGGDATKILFGFCINDCSGTGSNANGDQAAQVMIDLANTYSCHGGAFFWVATDDQQGTWSSTVNTAIAASTTCVTDENLPADTPSPTTLAVAPSTTSPAPVAITNAPTPTRAPTFVPTHRPTNGIRGQGPSIAADEPCCPTGYSGMMAFDNCMQYYHCTNGEVVGSISPCPAGTLFDNDFQYCNWALEVSCFGNAGCSEIPSPTTSVPTMPSPATIGPTNAPTTFPTTGSTTSPTTPVPTFVTVSPSTNVPVPVETPRTVAPTSLAPDNTNSGEEPCCPPDYTGLHPFGDCQQYYHCQNGEVISSPMNCPEGTLFDTNLQLCNWASQVPSCSTAISC